MTLVIINNSPKNALIPGFNDVFDSIFNDTFFTDHMMSRVPAVNISESENNYHVERAAPGLKKNFQIEPGTQQPDYFGGAKLSSSRQLKAYSKCEYSYTSFVRSFILFPNAFELTGLRNKKK